MDWSNEDCPQQSKLLFEKKKKGVGVGGWNGWIRTKKKRNQGERTCYFGREGQKNVVEKGWKGVTTVSEKTKTKGVKKKNRIRPGNKVMGGTGFNQPVRGTKPKVIPVGFHTNRDTIWGLVRAWARDKEDFTKKR